MNTPTLFQKITRLGLILMMGVSLSACAGLGGTSWKEEVLLHDGSKIIVKRTVDRGGRHEIGQRPPIGNQSISFTMPESNRQVVWKDEFSKDVSGANFLLMGLDVVQDSAYLIVTPMGCLSYNKWGRPNPPYVIFKHNGKEWNRIPLQELPAEIKLPNMLHSSPDEVAEKTKKDGIVSAEVIKLENEGFRQPEYRTILRESIQSAGQGCGEMIFDGHGGWIGTGWFSEQPSKEACFKYCEREEVPAQYCPCNRLFKGK